MLFEEQNKIDKKNWYAFFPNYFYEPQSESLILYQGHSVMP